MYAGRFDEALTHVRRARQVAPDLVGFEVRPVSGIEGLVLALLGRVDEARAILEGEVAMPTTASGRAPRPDSSSGVFSRSTPPSRA